MYNSLENFVQETKVYRPHHVLYLGSFVSFRQVSYRLKRYIISVILL